MAVAASVPARGEGGDVEPLQEDGHIDALADDAGGAHQDSARFNSQESGGARGGSLGVAQALGPGAGVGAPGVEDDGTGAAWLASLLTG